MDIQTSHIGVNLMSLKILHVLLNSWVWTYVCLFGTNTEKEKENDKYC